GADLATVLESLVGAWPVRVRRLILIGHSMGGLVIRSACHAATLAGCRWPALAGHVVTLGAPHHGAPLAKAVHAAAWAFRAVPEPPQSVRNVGGLGHFDLLDHPAVYEVMRGAIAEESSFGAAG